MIRARTEWVIRKRDGRTVPFDSGLIGRAIANAFRAELNLADQQPLDAESDEEIRRICEFTGMSTDTLHKKHLRRVFTRYSLTERRNGDCTFLKHEDGKRMCSIYPVRPLQCRTYPFWTSNLSSRREWNDVASGCPGMNSGKHYNYDEIETIRKKKDW